MNDQKLKQQLNQDAKPFQQLAEKHLSAKKINALLMNQLNQTEQMNKQVTNKSTQWKWPVSLAAAVCLAVLLWHNNQVVTPNNDLIELKNNSPLLFNLQLSDIPLSIETKTNQRLMQEQHAIWSDLKTLQKSWINI